MREELVAATPELVAGYLGKPPAYSFRGVIALRDGEPIGMAGIYDENGTAVAFSEYRDPPPNRRIRVAAVRAVEALMDARKAPIYAICSRQLETAQALLARVGFVSTGLSCERGDIMVRFHVPTS